MKRWLIWLLLASSTLLLLAYIFAGDNIHTIAGGKVTRTSQLSSSKLRRIIESNEIQTVLSLRGEDGPVEWLKEETALCSELGVEFVTVEGNAHILPSVKAIRTIISVWDEKPGPILVHCLSGKDRTGLASAIFEILNGSDLDEALKQLSWRYFHLCNRQKCLLHRFFSHYREYLNRAGINHSTRTFRKWALESYYPSPYAAEIKTTEFPETLAPGKEGEGVIEVTNLSDEAWKMHADPLSGIRFGIRTLGPLEERPPGDILEIELLFHRNRFEAEDLLRIGVIEDTWLPGEKREITFQFNAPTTPGTYIYRLDMVDEMVTWFYVRGYPATYQVLEVTAD